MCMTYPLIETIPGDYEFTKIWLEAIFIHELATQESKFRSVVNLNEFLVQNEIPGLKNINTRKLTKILRENGTMKGILTDDISNISLIIKKIKNHSKTWMHSYIISIKIKRIESERI